MNSFLYSHFLRVALLLFLWLPQLFANVYIDYAYKLLCSNRTSLINTILFTPQDKVKEALLGLIYSEKRSIYAALYRITDPDIVHALLHAKKRGVYVEIITDKGALKGQHEKISRLKRSGIRVNVYKKMYSIMHHKFFIFNRSLNNKSVIFYGSANATIGGTTRNQEAVHIWSNWPAIQLFSKQFFRMKQEIINSNKKK